MRYGKRENSNVKIYGRLPKTYTSKTESDILNFDKSSIEVINSKGFYEVIEADLGENQKVGTPYFDASDDKVKFNIVDLTAEEIAVNEQNALDNDESAQKVINAREDGRREHKRIWDRIMRLYDNNQLTEGQFDTIAELLFDAILPLELGLWEVAQSRVDDLPTASGILGQIRTAVKEIIDNYIIDNQ